MQKHYFNAIKVETTINIEADLLEQVKIAAIGFRDYSEVFEKALVDYLPKLKSKMSRQRLTRKEEIKILNRIGTEQREEILENLEYQIDLSNAANFSDYQSLQSAIRRGFAFMSSSAVMI